ncbi:MAG: 50S ribosomal protein L11 methyltransferase [Proteobacteria bacterium]|nr:50S ribosomal protein L11 methyltransferase [Pseudomonadota bacterium]
MYKISFKTSHNFVFDTVDMLDLYFDTVSCFEDESSGESQSLDADDFPIANLFDVDIIVLDKTQFHLIEYLLNDSNCSFQDLKIEPIENQDWLTACYKNFEPIEVGSFFIHSSYAPEKVPEGKVGLLIDAATAFGSGEHQTTRSCLMAIEKAFIEQSDIQSVLDMGCGSGILGIATALMAPSISVLGVDIDQKAVDVANNNAQLNKVSNFKAIESAGFSNIEKTASFDLIVANILARPLIEMAPFIKQQAKENSIIILSGLLKRQQKDVVKAYEEQGFELDFVHSIDDWVALTLRPTKS